MANLRLPEEIRGALTLMVADRYEIPWAQAYFWITDIERKGTQSIFFEQVKPIGKEFFEPILSILLPALKQIVEAAVSAGIIRAKLVMAEADEKENV